MASGEHAQFEAAPVLGSDATDDARSDYRGELEAMQERSNGLTYGFYVAGGVGLALGVVTVVTW